MTKIAISPNVNGTGTFTIAAPDSNTDRTLTLPDAGGTVNTSGQANEVPAGSAAAPSVFPTGDTNTGLFFPASDITAFATGGLERMRVAANGDLRVGIINNGNSAKVSIDKAAGDTFETAHLELRSTAGNVALGFHAAGATAVNLRHVRGFAQLQVINSIGSAFAPIEASAFNVNSDYRIKENITPLTGAADRLMQLPVHRFSFVAGSMSYQGGVTVDGFLAHEAQVVVPEAVTGEKDAVDADGNPILQAIDQSKLVPLLTAALQEALADIATLKAEVAALKGVPA